MAAALPGLQHWQLRRKRMGSFLLLPKTLWSLAAAHLVILNKRVLVQKWSSDIAKNSGAVSEGEIAHYNISKCLINIR